MLSTDMMYFAVASANFSGGAQITASHNPKQYNGMKLVGREAFPLSGDAGISDIRDMIAQDRLPPTAERSGRVAPKDVLNPYVDHVMGFIDPAIVRPFAVVLDAGCLAEDVLHEQARLEDRPADTAALEPLFDRQVAASHDRGCIGKRDCGRYG